MVPLLVPSLVIWMCLWRLAVPLNLTLWECRSRLSVTAVSVTLVLSVIRCVFSDEVLLMSGRWRPLRHLTRVP